MKRGTKPPGQLGDVILIPLENRKFGVAHVIAIKGPSAGMALSSYVGPKPRTLEDAPSKPHLREASVGKGGMLDGLPCVATRWVSRPLPRGFVRLGARAPTAADTKLTVDVYAADWAGLARTLLILWLRANDPTGADALFAKWQRQAARAQRDREKTEKDRVAVLTLEGLARGTPLGKWTKRYPAKVVTAARAILRGLAREFHTLGPKSAARARTDALRFAVERFNALDGKGGFTILTTEREDLCAAFLDITRAAKMKTAVDPTERWRDW